MKICLGEPDTAIEHAALAMRLSPLDPRLFVWQSTQRSLISVLAAMTMRSHGRKERCGTSQIMRMHCALRRQVTHWPDRWLKRRRRRRLYKIYPLLRLSNLEDVLSPLRRPGDRARFVEGLRRAGLPE